MKRISQWFGWIGNTPPYSAKDALTEVKSHHTEYPICWFNWNPPFITAKATVTRKALKKYIICNMPKSLLNGISPLYSDKVKKKVLMRVKLTRVDLSSYVTETIPQTLKNRQDLTFMKYATSSL